MVQNKLKKNELKTTNKVREKAVDDLQKACNNLPPTFWCYLNSAGISIMRFPEGGKDVLVDGIHNDLQVHTVMVGSKYGKGCTWDGGDW